MHKRAILWVIACLSACQRSDAKPSQGLEKNNLSIPSGSFPKRATAAPESVNAPDSKFSFAEEQITAVAPKPLLPTDCQNRHQGIPENQLQPRMDWLLVPGVRAGPITASTSVTELRKIFGSKNVSIKSIVLPEDDSAQIVEIYPNDATRSLELHWYSAEKDNSFESASFGTSDSLWHTSYGIKPGLTIRQTEEINGGPFLLSGFGWDYPGYVRGWECGVLPPQSLEVQFNENFSGLSDAEILEQTGDSRLPSNKPSVQKSKHTISEVTVYLR